MVEAVPIKRISLHGIPLDAITEQQCIGQIINSLEKGTGGVVVTHNLDHMRRLESDPEFARLCADAELRVADGMPLIWASKLLGTPLPERVAGSSLISTLSAAAAEKNRSIFLLGGEEGTAEEAARVLKQRHPTLRIAGTFYPPPGFENDQIQMNLLEAALASSEADIVFVAVGSPKQERLIAALRHLLPHAWWMGVGISFSFVAGRVSRAPAWMQRAGLEWAHRLAQEPGRLARRYLVHGFPFAARMLTRAAIERYSKAEADPASVTIPVRDEESLTV